MLSSAAAVVIALPPWNADRRLPGQALTTTTTLGPGPSPDDEDDGPDAVNVVIIDNGRSELIGKELEEALNCIRCRACLHDSPVYQQIGGNANG